MKKMKKIVMLALMLTTLVALPLIAHADVEDRLYDFTDTHYRRNGVDPSRIVGRRNGADNLSVFDTPFFSIHRNVRTILTIPAYDHSGDIVFFTVMGELFADGFTNDRAGMRARQIGDKYIEYVFVTRGSNPVGLGNFRQSALLDMRNGYFSNDPLGLWTHVWVSYTERAFNTRDGIRTLAELERRNGRSLDGTPIIKTVSEIDNLVSKGLAEKRLRKMDGSEGAVYSICPVIKDPTDGGIASDAFLAFTRNPDGTPLEPQFVINFDSLKFTGDWAD
jgi:hypothetical protein